MPRTLTEPVSTSSAKETLSPEQLQVVEWRREVIEGLGYSLVEAEDMARSKIDLNQLRALLKNGATLEQARRILVGTDFLGDEHDYSRGNFMTKTDDSNGRSPKPSRRTRRSISA